MQIAGPAALDTLDSVEQTPSECLIDAPIRSIVRTRLANVYRLTDLAEHTFMAADLDLDGFKADT